MPVVFDPGSDKIRAWLDPAQHEWSRALQSLLRSFDGDLDVYPVTKDVGKVGNNSPSFVIPLDSRENKSNIANFFANAQQKEEAKAKQDTGSEAATKPGSSPGNAEQGARKKRKAAPTEADSPPPKKRPVTRNKISSTKNEHKSPVKGKSQPGSQKITNFFGNSA